MNLKVTKMKRRYIKIVFITFFIVISTIPFNSCSKIDGSKRTKESFYSILLENKSVIKEDYKKKLIDLNIRIWKELASKPISEIEKVCEEDPVKLMQLIDLSNEEVQDIMNKAIFYAKEISKNSVLEGCDCGNDVNYDDIVDFIRKIQSNGGAEVFFNNFNKNQSNLKVYDLKYDSDKLVECEAACVLACLPLGWNPPAWATCWLVCTAACYAI